MDVISGNLTVVELIRAYADEQLTMMGDGVLHDPVLAAGFKGGKHLTEVDFAKSRECQIHSTVHSSKYHAACDILELLGENPDLATPDAVDPKET